MRSLLILFVSLILTVSIFPQNQFKAVITEHHSGETLAGVNALLIGTALGAASDQDGIIEIKNIPDGSYQVRFSFIGYEEVIINVTFPADDKIFEIELEEEAEELEEISVSSTRGSRLIGNEPTRVEVIAGEEVDEKISMDPSNISMMLNESTGIQVQQTSAASANNSFRIQGLDGRYTQLLKDGFPLYSGFSGSLSIVQIPPLDLKQIEIIKGSSSTLYGGGAIAGLINLISKEPDPNGEISFLLNGTTAGGIDLSGFYSNKTENTGITLLASRNTQIAYDNNDDNFSDLPEVERYNISPRIYFYTGEHTIMVGGTFITEERLGGAIPKIEGSSDSIYSYTEKNESKRFASQFMYEYLIDDRNKFKVKNSIGYFNRDIHLPSYLFRGKQLSSFSEATFNSGDETFEWIVGVNLLTENFDDESEVTSKRNYSDLTAGLFAQLTYDISELHSIEAGLRTDYAKDYNFFVLPKISFLSKWNKNFTTRIGGGLGYKLPTIFTEASDEISFRNLLPVDKEKVKAEKSFGFNLDFNFNTILFNEITLSLNNLFFYTRINDPLILVQNSTNNNLLEFTSFPGYYDTKGIEINLKLTYHQLKLFSGYTFTDVLSQNSVKNEMPLTPKNRVGLVLIFEEHENYRIGLEAYYTGKQKLITGETVTDYWINGFMIEKHFDNISLFLNFENFLDTRQSRYGQMFTGSPSNPEFADIYAPTDGRIINGGIKIRL